MIKTKIILYLILFFLILIGIVFFASQKEGSTIFEENREAINEISATSTPIVGGDKDAHGCIGSAGYTWCEIKQKCLRAWEEKCEIVSVPVKKDETINWKTYKNAQYGFELKYPETATITESGETYISFPSSDAKLYISVGKTTSVPLMGVFGGRFEYSGDERPDFMLLSEIGGVFTKDYFAVSVDGKTWDRVINAHKEKEGNYFLFSMYNVTHDTARGGTASVFLSEMRNKENVDVGVFNKILSTFKFL